MQHAPSHFREPRTCVLEALDPPHQVTHVPLPRNPNRKPRRELDELVIWAT